MKTYGVIPARLQSTRLPRKLLLAETGKPLLQYTWEQARQASSIDDVLIATDSDEIASAARSFGAKCEMTGDHPSGTDRIAEVVRRALPDAETIVNIQGDEPEIDPLHIDLLVTILKEHPQAQMATLATPIRTLHELQQSSCTKVVCTPDGRALYFSRCPIPFTRDVAPESLLPDKSPWLLHLGIYAYRHDFLLELTTLSPSRLERWEKLEQLRALEAGAIIQVGVVESHAVGIDTPDDYAQFIERQRILR
ncbi:MAG: 3-deoxy-manno-octulosonate cytidylyltransferase [Planctomycetaceae bacterium]